MNRIVFFHRNKKAGYSIEKVSRPFVERIENKDIFYLPAARANPFSLLKNIFFITKKRKRNAIHHITGDAHYGILGLIGRKSILNVHDTGTVDFFNKNKTFKRFILRLLWFKLPLRLASKVVCVSHCTKSYVEHITKRKDIIVIPNSVDDDIEFRPKGINAAKTKILIIGTNPNKNIERQIQSLAGMNCIVTIVGKISPEHEQMLSNLNIEYINKCNLSDAEVYNEYYEADILLFCSLFEGFGMPIIEANRAGTPVICSDIPVLKEVGGKGAYYVNPYNISDIKEGINRVLTDKNLHHKLISEGLKNSERFEIKNIFPLWTEVYESIS